MHIKSLKRAIVFALVLTMLMPLGSVAAENDDADSTTGDTAAVTSTEDTNEETKDESKDSEKEDSDEDEEDEEEIEPITDEEAVKLETCEEVASNDKFILYADSENDRICLYVKESNKYWWSSPINVASDHTTVDGSKTEEMKTQTRKKIASSVAIRYADLRQAKRVESSALYSNKAKEVKYKPNSKGVTVTYQYAPKGFDANDEKWEKKNKDNLITINITVHYELEDDDLYVYADTSEIEELDPNPDDGKVLTKILLCPSFAAAPAKDLDGNPTEGYMIVPDGSGAVINYNNGKVSYSTYSHQIYGRDYTMVPQTEPHINQQAYMPVLATVSGKSGVVAIATDGDANVTAKAQVSGQNKQAYNSCYFEFETRGSDSFYMSGEGSNEITVFEKNGKIKGKRFGVKYYPIDKDEDVNYADCAEVYRNYLIENKGLTSKVTDNKTNFYVDLFGGVMKTKSIIGVPVNLKTDITGYTEAEEIINKLKDNGINNIVANYNDWTDYSMKHKVSTEVDPSGTLGDEDDFFKLVKDSNAEVYPSMNNFTMDSGRLGYMTLTSTAIRISSAYSRQSKYSPAFGVALKGVSPALISPSVYSKVFDEMIDSYKENGLKTIGFGDYSYKLVSDHAKKDPYSREKTMETIISGYEKAEKEVGSVIADSANAYVLPYVSHVTNVPLYSSGYNITDYDIPFYQMVVHGYVPYSTKPINASSDIDETFMLALAAGSAIHYDMTYKPASKLQDTDYNKLGYSNYKGWLDYAAEHYKSADEVLSDVAAMTISKYEISDDNNTITTTYTDGSKEVEIVINKADATATVDGKTISLEGAMEGGFDADE